MRRFWKVFIHQTLESSDFSSMKLMRKLAYPIVFEWNASHNSLFFHSLMNRINKLCDHHQHFLQHEIEMGMSREEFQITQYLLPCFLKHLRCAFWAFLHDIDDVPSLITFFFQLHLRLSIRCFLPRWHQVTFLARYHYPKIWYRCLGVNVDFNLLAYMVLYREKI